MIKSNKKNPNNFGFEKSKIINLEIRDKCIIVQMCKCINLRMYKCIKVQMHKYTNAYM